MRLKIVLDPIGTFEYKDINEYLIQSTIYSFLKDSDFRQMHDMTTFKFFCFSNIHPINDYKEGEYKNLLISSPIKPLINFIYDKIEKNSIIRIGTHKFKIVEKKKFDLKFNSKFITTTPIVLYKDNKTNTYFSFKRDNNLDFFLNRIKENALKKYNAFYDENLNFEGHIFDRLIFRKDVVVTLRKHQNDFIIIGTQWKLLEKMYIPKDLRKFYKFILDCGLGEKNSMGFGFINPIERYKS